MTLKSRTQELDTNGEQAGIRQLCKPTGLMFQAVLILRDRQHIYESLDGGRAEQVCIAASPSDAGASLAAPLRVK